MERFFSWLTLLALVMGATLNASASDPLPFGQWSKTPWEGKYMYSPEAPDFYDYTEPIANWTAADFDDSSWETIQGPIADPGHDAYYATEWNVTEGAGQYWVRRTFTLTEISEVPYLLVYTHNSGARIFLNGQEIYEYSSSNNQDMLVPTEYFVIGKNVLSMWVTNYYSYYPYLDFGLYERTTNLTPITTAANNVDYTIINDPEHPWIQSLGQIQSDPTWIAEGESGSSSIKVQFTTSNPGKFWVTRESNNNSDHQSYCKLDGERIDYSTFGFDAGTHTVEIVDYNSSGSRSSTTISRIDIMEYRDWITAPATPNGLSASVLEQGTSLNDVRCLKVTGEMNDACFNHISQMKNLCAIDMSEATAESITDDTFSNKEELTYALLPQGTKYIGESAFNSSSLCLTYIPETVEEIGEYAFGNTELRNITLPNSVKKLGYGSFEGSDLHSVILSDNIVSLPMYCFYRCHKLKLVTIPVNLKEIGGYCFNACDSLETITLPETIVSLGYNCFTGSGLKSIDIPQSVREIGSRAFSSTPIEEIVLPYYNYQVYYNTFSYCPNLKKVTFTSLCPPSQIDMFSGVPDGLTLVVPSATITAYRNDMYFNQYNIVAADDPSKWVIGKEFTLENEMRTSVKPDLEIVADEFYSDYEDRRIINVGHLTVNGSTPLSLGKVSLGYINNYEGYATLISNCNALTADTLEMVHDSYGSSDRWYFLTPFADVNPADIKVEYSGTDEAPESLDYAIRYYDGASRAANGSGSNWANLAGQTMKAGQGYIFRSPYPVKLTLPGAANGNVAALSANAATLTLHDYPSAFENDKNWNLIGNPYACFFDIMHMDYPAPITTWDGYSYYAYTLTDDEYALRPGEAFFVQKPDNVSAITFALEGRQHTSEINHANGVRQLNAENGYSRYVVDLTIGDGVMEDRTRVVLNEEASLGYELSCDASKFMSMNRDVPQIYTVDDNNTRLAINERPVADGECRLGVYLPVASKEYSIRATRAQTPVYLYDKETSAEAYLTDGAEYLFTASKKGYDDNRFILRVAPTALDGIEAVKTRVEAGKGYIRVVAEEGTATITGIDGIVYYRGEPTTVELQRGVYVVAVSGKNHKVLVK